MSVQGQLPYLLLISVNEVDELPEPFTCGFNSEMMALHSTTSIAN